MRAAILDSSRSRRAIAVVVACAGTLVVAAAAATAAVGAGTLNLSTIAIGTDDLPGSKKIARQGYVKADTGVAASYEREFAPGANIGHGLALLLDNEIDELTTATAAHSYYAATRRFIATSAGRQLFAAAIVPAFTNKKQKRKAKLTFGRIQLLSAGNETFVQQMTLTTTSPTATLRFPLVISLTRADRVVSSLTILGLPGGKVAGQDIQQLQRAVSTHVAAALAPVNTVAPSITGTAVQGQTLTGADGTWTNDPTLTRSWLRCDAAGNACVAIAGATTTTYVLTPQDVGFTIRYSVGASGPSGNVPAVPSAQTAVVVAAAPAP